MTPAILRHDLALAALLGFATAAAPFAAAQQILSLTPDTLYFLNAPPNQLVLRNSGTDSVRVDSIGFSNWSPYGWRVGLITATDTVDFEFLAGRLEWSDGERSIDLSAGDSAVIDLIGWDGCPICKTSVSSDDTLFVFADGLTAASVHSRIDFSRYVGFESTSQDGEIELALYPNPAANVLWIGSGRWSPGAHYSIFDVLGRRRRGPVSVHSGGAATGELRIDISDLPTARYFIQVADGRTTRSHAFIIIR